MESNSDNSWRMEALLESKAFDELTGEEREFVLKELGSEEQYHVLRKISAALVAEKADLSPDPRVLTRLRGELKKNAPVPWFRQVIDYRVPAYLMIAPIVLIALGILWLNGNDDDAIRGETITTIQRDTLYVVTPADTIFVDRVVVKYLKPQRSEDADYSLVRNNPEEANASEGVNMKEKEELERFLVSGS